MSIRWISDVPSKIVKILECMGRVIGIPARGFQSPCAWGTAALSVAAHGFQPHGSPPATHADGASSAEEIWVHDDEPGAESLLAAEPMRDFSLSAQGTFPRSGFSRKHPENGRTRPDRLTRQQDRQVGSARAPRAAGVNGMTGPAAATASLCAQMPPLSSSGAQPRPLVQRG
jgi:hypothetical protein